MGGDMTERACWGVRRTILAGICLVAAAGQRTPAIAPLGPAAYLVVDIASGRTIASARNDILRSPVLPGSIVKIAAVMAALESRTIEPGTALACHHDITVDGHRLICAHPALGRPLTPAEALAHSCNDYIATIAKRMPRAAFNDALGRLGLPPVPASVPLVSAAVGLDGNRVTPEQLLRGFIRLIGRPPPIGMRESTRQVLMDGLRGCASYGTASALRASGFTALAKTGTAPMPGGGFEGLVVAAVPADAPARAVVVVAPGAAGTDAAAIAAGVLRSTAGEGVPAEAILRIGIARPGGGFDVAAIPIEEYVARVVAAEQAPGSPDTALQALAITVRTFALANRGRHRADGFDLCDLTHCQVVGRATAAAREAAAKTQGRVLLYRGEPAPVFYTAWCGGHTERPSTAWPGSNDVPFLPSRPDPGCERLPRWTSEIAARDLERAARAAGLRGDRLLDLTVAERAESGRVARVRLAGFVPGDITGENLRLAVGRALGWSLLKSTAFDVVRTASGYRFTGTGSGHGVGLCVTGSARMAAHGRSPGQILEAYFPGLDIGTGDTGPSPALAAGRSDSRILVSLPAGEEGERTLVGGLAERAVDEIARKTGVVRPAVIRLEFHATVEAYQRASGQPWWTAGSARDGHIDLLPLSALRSRGILERTVRHEIAHVLTAPRLGGRPLWVTEGAAIFFSGEPLGPADRAACPSDDELGHSRSAEELRAAYARAGACFARAIAAGRPWDSIR
jgi:SpoIID/LytB domain protein